MRAHARVIWNTESFILDLIVDMHGTIIDLPRGIVFRLFIGAMTNNICIERGKYAGSMEYILLHHSHGKSVLII